MVENIVQEKVAASSWNLGDFFAVSVVKSLEEAALMPVLGTGTLKSGVVKGVAGIVVSQMVGNKPDMVSKIGRYAAAGLVIDGFDDIVKAVVAPAIAKATGQATGASSATMADTISG